MSRIIGQALGAVGDAIGKAAGATASVAGAVIGAAGEGTYRVAKAAAPSAETIKNVADKVGDAGASVAGFMYGAMPRREAAFAVGMAGKGIYEAGRRTLRNTVTEVRHAGKVGKDGKWQAGGNSYGLTDKGYALLMGAGLAGGTVSALSDYKTATLGNIDASSVVTATPTVQAKKEPLLTSRVDNGGATGDLVFALYNNRHG